MSDFLELSFALGGLDPEAAEAACFEAGASAVTFADAADDPVLEPAPGEVRLWRNTILTGLFAPPADTLGLVRTLGHALNIPPERIATRHLEDRAWEREWLRDFHAMRFGERLWVCPHHERVADPRAVVSGSIRDSPSAPVPMPAPRCAWRGSMRSCCPGPG